MTPAVTKAISVLNSIFPDGFEATVQFDILGHGQITLDGDGAREGSSDAELTVRAQAETFADILEGRQDATAAYLSGKLSISGDFALATKLVRMLN